MAEQSRFPMVIDKCPQCGSPETMCKVAWAEEAAEGRVNADTKVAAEMVQFPLIDPKRALSITTNILVIATDYCANCGTRYCTRAEIIKGQVTMKKQGPPPGGGFSPLAR